MKRLSILVLLLLSGCAQLNVTKTLPDGTKTAFSGWALFSNTAFRGLFVDEVSPRFGTNLLAVTGATNSPNAESITASADALGTLIGTAAKAAAAP